MPSKNNGFTASDIERYHSGKMSPEERHALEKAALDDPFLADALEGYAFTPAPSDDLAKIQSRLDEKFNQKKVVPLFQKYKWLSVAAIVLITAGAGWLTYTISNKESNSIATAEKFEKPKAENNSVKASNDTTFDTTLSKQPQKPIQTSADKVPQLKNVPIEKKTKKQPDIRRDKKAIALKNEQSYSKSTSPSVNKNEMASTRNEIVHNNVQREFTDNAIPSGRMNEVVTIRKQDALKDSAGNSASIRIRGVAANDTIKNLNIILHPLPMDSSQTVVIAKGVQKKSTNKYPKVIIDTLEPAGGYVNFDDYVANNLKMPEELKDKPTSGEVQLSFGVDQNGQPTDITVVKSLCQKCDEEAIRLLKEGPKWKKKKNKKGKITIRF